MKLVSFILLFVVIQLSTCLLPPRFQWKVIDFAWQGNERDAAMASGAYIPENNMPTGIARWRDKLFITIPRWKKGVPASLNYVYLNGSQSQPLMPYPDWQSGFYKPNTLSNTTVVSTFRVHVDNFDRLWIVDNGVDDMTGDVKQLCEPSIVIFDLNTDTLLHRYVLPVDVLRESSVLTNIVVDIAGSDKKGSDTFAYISDMGSNAIIVYSLKKDSAWRVENHYFHFDPNAGVYNVGGIDFYWSDGVSSTALSAPKGKGYRELYLQPTSSTRLFKISTQLLRENVPAEKIYNGVDVVGDRGPKSQVTACDFDYNNNVLFYTQLSKNGVGCWNVDKPFTVENNPLLMSDCNILEFPNDIKVDQEGNLWILSDRQSRFLYQTMDFNEVNFRVLTAPVAAMIAGTPCQRAYQGKRLFSKRS